MTPKLKHHRAWRRAVLLCLPFVLAACAHSPADDERAALLRKAAEVDRSYLHFSRGELDADLAKRRLKSIVALIKKIENVTPPEIIDRALEDALNEAGRLYDADAKELCDVIHFAGAFYAKHSQSQKAEQLYSKHIEALIAPHKLSNLQNIKLQPKVAIAASEDMDLLAALLNAKGKNTEALECSQQAKLLRQKAGELDVVPGKTF